MCSLYGTMCFAKCDKKFVQYYVKATILFIINRRLKC